MKVMVSFPPLKGPGHPMLTQNRQFQWYNNYSFIFPLVAASAATLLKDEGFDSIWDDCITERRGYDEFLSHYERSRPDLTALETKTPVVKQHWRIIDDMKRVHPQGRVALMGDHVTALPEESMQASRTDYVITGGNFDVTLLHLARHLADGSRELPGGIYSRRNGGIENTGPFDRDVDLDALPFIDRDLTNSHLYGEQWIKDRPFAYTMAGRDCPWSKCTFCSWTAIHPEFHVRSPERHLDEIGMLIERYGMREIFDDTGTFPEGGWLRRFCEGMIERGYNRRIKFSCNWRFSYTKDLETFKLMKRAGWRRIKGGLEAGNDESLKRLNKGCTVDEIVESCRAASGAGIEVHLTIMVGYPWETRAQALQTFDLARELMRKGWAHSLQSTVLIPYPGTRLHEEAVERGWLRFTDWDRYGMREPVLTHPEMTPEEILELCGRTYRLFLHPRVIMRNLLAVRSFRDIKFLLRGAKAIAGHFGDFANASVFKPTRSRR